MDAIELVQRLHEHRVHVNRISARRGAHLRPASCTRNFSSVKAPSGSHCCISTQPTTCGSRRCRVTKSRCCRAMFATSFPATNWVTVPWCRSVNSRLRGPSWIGGGRSILSLLDPESLDEIVYKVSTSSGKGRRLGNASRRCTAARVYPRRVYDCSGHQHVPAAGRRVATGRHAHHIGTPPDARAAGRA